MMPNAGRARAVAAGLVALALALAMAGPAAAQEFSRYLACTGEATSGQRHAPAHADFALRFTNRTALVQRSNVLPVGERLAYVPSPAAYTMTYRVRPQGTDVVVVPGWLQSTVLVMLPDLRRLNQIRLSIDRQTGALEASLLNEEEQSLGTVAMQCRSMSEQDLGEPKF